MKTSSVAVTLIAAALHAVEASDCLSNVSNSTIALFSGAPVAFGYNATRPVFCGRQCESLPLCKGWLYVQNGACELYGTEATMLADAPNFFYGACAKSQNSTTTAPLLHAVTR